MTENTIQALAKNIERLAEARPHLAPLFQAFVQVDIVQEQGRGRWPSCLGGTPCHPRETGKWGPVK